MANNETLAISIEGDQLQLTGLNIIPGIPFRKNNQFFYRVDIKRRGESEILKELNPKKAIVDDASQLDKGSKIRGKTLSGYSLTMVKRDKLKVGKKGRSSGHKGQDVKINGSCYMAVIEGHTSYTAKTHPKNLDQIKQIETT